MKAFKKYKGFTLIELVIVVAVLGVLSLMVAPQFQNVTQDAKQKVFEANVKTIISAYGIYQAANDGKVPQNMKDLDTYLTGGFASLQNKPAGAVYELSKGQFKASYKDKKLNQHDYFYPQ